MRLLTAGEIDCRIGNTTEKGASILLYKDARVDMRILDETYGSMNWQRRHEVVNGNLFCTIEVWDSEKGCWVSKQDVGTESFTEKEKGEASDSFKRAGFNWGIGRELYTAPFIWITTTSDDLDNRGKIKTKFFVREIDYNEQNEINHLVIVDGKGNARFTFGEKAKSNTPQRQSQNKHSITLAEAIAEMYATESYDAVVNCWKKYPQYSKEETFIRACTEQGVKYRPAS
jgi:hypothetical protein